MAPFGSVTSAVGKYSSGGHSMSTQSTSCPAVMRLVGGGMATTEAGGATLSGALLAAALGEPEPPCRHAARRIAVASRATNGFLPIFTVRLLKLRVVGLPSGVCTRLGGSRQ